MLVLLAVVLVTRAAEAEQTPTGTPTNAPTPVCPSDISDFKGEECLAVGRVVDCGKGYRTTQWYRNGGTCAKGEIVHTECYKFWSLGSCELGIALVGADKENKDLCIKYEVNNSGPTRTKRYCTPQAPPQCEWVSGLDHWEQYGLVMPHVMPEGEGCVTKGLATILQDGPLAAEQFCRGKGGDGSIELEGRTALERELFKDAADQGDADDFREKACNSQKYSGRPGGKKYEEPCVWVTNKDLVGSYAGCMSSSMKKALEDHWDPEEIRCQHVTDQKECRKHSMCDWNLKCPIFTYEWTNCVDQNEATEGCHGKSYLDMANACSKIKNETMCTASSAAATKISVAILVALASSLWA